MSHVSDGWLRAIDEALVVHHVGIANADDDYETARKILNLLLCVAQDIGAHHAAPGGWTIGDVSAPEDNPGKASWIATIDVDGHGSAIECHGSTREEAEALWYAIRGAKNAGAIGTSAHMAFYINLSNWFSNEARL